MNRELAGSELTRAMLRRGDNQVWCVTSNESDAKALDAISNENYGWICHIVSFSDGYFFCSKGHAWPYAFPIKKATIRQSEVGL